MTNEQIKLFGKALIAFGQVLAGENSAQTTAAQVVEAVSDAIDSTIETPKETKKSTKKKTSKKSTATKAKEAEPDDGNEAEQAESNGAASFTHDDLRKALVDFAKKNGKAKAYDLLSEFGAKKAIEVPENKLGEVFTRMGAVQ